MNKLKTCGCGEPTYGNKCGLCASEQGLFKAPEQSEIDELRARNSFLQGQLEGADLVLQERDAEIERLTGVAFLASVERDELRMELGDLPEAQADMLATIKAQRKVLEQALDALQWFNYDEQWQSANRPHWFIEAITAIQEQLA